MNEPRCPETNLHKTRFCVLGYRPREESSADKTAAPLVVLLLWDQESSPQILAHPELNKIVSREDLDYLESLLQDFLERAKLEPEALFKQASSLGVGPLVTVEAGPSISDFPSISEMCSSFVEP